MMHDQFLQMPILVCKASGLQNQAKLLCAFLTLEENNVKVLISDKLQ